MFVALLLSLFRSDAALAFAMVSLGLCVLIPAEIHVVRRVASTAIMRALHLFGHSGDQGQSFHEGMIRSAAVSLGRGHVWRYSGLEGGSAFFGVIPF